MPRFTVAGRSFTLDREAVERVVDGQLPDPLTEHYVVVRGRRYPPKQVVCLVTGLDRADFTTHQARRVLLRLGFTAARVHPPKGGTGRSSSGNGDAEREEPRSGPYGGAQAEALAPFRGQWVALASPTDVLVAAADPRDVVAWLARHGKRASYGMFRVPERDAEARGAAPA